MTIAARTVSIARIAARRALVARPCVGHARFLSGGNITYSGGQAFEGQGGFYSSGGARAAAPSTKDVEGREFMLAVASDVKAISQVMDEVDRLESLLRSEGDSVSSKTIEMKSSIKKLVTAKDFVDALNRLEVEGAPVWGLSTDEREMIVYAREKMNNS